MTSNNSDAIKFEQNGSCVVFMNKITFEQATKFVAYPVCLDGKAYGPYPQYEWIYLNEDKPTQIKKLMFKFEKTIITGPNFPYASVKDVPGKGPLDMGPKKANVTFSFDNKFNEGIIQIWNYFELCFRAAYLMTLIGPNGKYLTLYPYYVKEAEATNAFNKIVKIEKFYNFNFLLHDFKQEKNFFGDNENSDSLIEFYNNIYANNKTIQQHVMPPSSFKLGDYVHVRFNVNPSMMTKSTRKDPKTKQDVPVDRIYLSPDFCMPKNGKVRLTADTDKKKATTASELAEMQTLKYWNMRINIAIPDKITGNIQTITSCGRGINLINFTPEIRESTGKIDTAMFEHKNVWMKLIKSNPEFNKLPVIIGNKSDSEKNMFIGCCTFSFTSVGTGAGTSKSHFMIEELSAIPGTVEFGNHGTVTGDTLDLGCEEFRSDDNEDTGLEMN